MRKPLAIVFALSLTAVMAYGVVGSAAWFTASDNVTVTATSGEINVTAAPATITLDNLMPGVWTDPVQFKIFNHPDSTVAVKYRVMDEFVDQSLAGFYDQIVIKVDLRFCDGIEVANPVVYQGAIGNLLFNNTSTPTFAASGLAINATTCYNVYFKLANDTPNTFQAQTAHFTLHVDATQLENPGWAE